MSNDTRTLAEVLGPWQQPDWESSLIERCRLAWSVPFRDLADAQLAMLLDQRFAVGYLLPIARERLKRGTSNDTELYDGQLQSAVARTANAA
jgi:hypothetical protein